MASQNWTEWNVTLEQVEEQMREEIRRAADKYFNQYLGLIQKTISSYPLIGGELGEKAKESAEKNVAVARDYIHKLSRAKDFSEVVPIQAEFMKSQFESFSKELKSLGETYTKAATDLLNTSIKTNGG
jgi:hypothetical protein